MKLFGLMVLCEDLNFFIQFLYWLYRYIQVFPSYFLSQFGNYFSENSFFMLSNLLA